MDDLIEDDGLGPNSGGNTPEYLVSEISGAVKKTLEGAFGRIRVRGEVGRVFTARSGHVYFDVKDERNVLASVCWKGNVARLLQRPEEGMEVVATGRLTTFGSQSKYQLTVDQLEPAGEGALMAMLEQRKRKLAAEGLFEEARKRPLPFLPKVIGVVTSPSGAVIRDILHRLAERFPRRVLVWPVAVQGRDCAAQVAAAIAGFNALGPGAPVPRPDLLIVARGGGSIEDLWGFNEEIVARAAAASDIPLISAVGHETDTTLIDYVSDWRAPTPTAAAERAVPVRLDLLGHVETLGGRLSGGLSRGLTRSRERLRATARALPRPARLLDGPRQRLDIAAQRLPDGLRRGVQQRRLFLAEASAALRPQGLAARLRSEKGRLERLAAPLRPDVALRGLRRQRRDVDSLSGRLPRGLAASLTTQRRRLDALGRVLETLSYRNTLSRGYAVVRDEGGHVLTTAEAARRASALDLEFSDARLPVGPVASPGPGKPRAGRPKARKAGAPPSEDQGTLF